MRINHNITALNTYNKLSANQATTAKSLEKLSSGLKINRAGDNAAGLAISEKMRGQIRGLDQSTSNANDGISLIKTAEGALNETHSILQRMRELAVQSSNDTNTDADRTEIQKEIDTLTSEVDRISTDTEFNTQKLLNGDKATKVTTSNTKDSAGNIKSSIIENTKVDGSIETGTYSATVSVQNAEFSKADFSQSKVLTDANGAVASFTNVGTTAGAYNGTVVGLGSATAGGVSLAADVTNTTVLAGKLNLSAGDYTLECTDATANTYRVLDSNNQQVGGLYTSDGSGDLNVNGTSVTITEATNDNESVTFSVANAYKIGTGDVTASGAPEAVSNLAVTLSADASVGDAFKIEIGATTAPITDLTKADLDAGSYQLVVSEYSDTGDGTATITIQDSKGNAVKDDYGNVLQINATDIETTDTEIGGITIQANTILGNSTNGFEITVAQKATATLRDSVGTVAEGITFEFNDTVEDGDTFSVAVNADNAMKFQIGANEAQNTSLSINEVGAQALGIDELDLTTQAGADAAITTIDTAISFVSSERAKLGAVQNRLEHTINNLGTSSENLSSAESRIRDVDMAKEMMEFTKNNILSQAAQSMLAQANQQPQGVLQLLQ